MTINQKKSIYLSPQKIDAEAPFAGDCFGREEHADRLTNLINRLPDGGVIAIDAPWGEGKSWFGENWRNKLAKNEYRTAYINAFERDYVEDPFVMIVAEVLKTVDSDSATGKKLKSSAIQLAKAIAPTVGKISINVVGKLLGTTDIAGEFEEQIGKVADGAADSAKNLISKRLEEYDKDQKSVEAFKEKLAACAAEQTKPIVIFIDELDRCRPDFAVKAIERIKHFFEIRNVVFVLLINKNQLCAAINGLYGSGVKADEYLGKFVNLIISLPKNTSVYRIYKNDNTRYCLSIFGKFGYDTNNQNCLGWAEKIGEIASVTQMSLRDLEKSVTYFVLFGENYGHSSIFVWLVSLKIKYSTLFLGIKNDDQKANEEAALLLGKIAFTVEENHSEFDVIVQMHRKIAHPNDPSVDDALQQALNSAFYRFGDWKALIKQHCELIDCLQ